MKLEDFKIEIIECSDSKTFCAFPSHPEFGGLIVQTENFQDIPKEISKSFGVMIKNSFESGNYNLKKYSLKDI